MSNYKLIAGSVLLAASACTPYLIAQEGPVPTQALITFDSKNVPASISAKDVMISAGTKEKQPLSALAPVQPVNVQIALLIDDGLRESLGTQLGDIKNFIQTLPPGAEILVGYMRNGTVVVEQQFTTDHALAASKIRLPFGTAGVDGSPYFCLSDLAKHWPGLGSTGSSRGELQASASPAKARFVMMLSSGIDPYNGSTSILNQDSPYVQAAGEDAERSGIAVYSIYFPQRGQRGGRGSFSGQSYLQQVAEQTGGQSFYQGSIPPVELLPYFKEFQKAVSETYVATFQAVSRHDDRDLVQIKMSTDLEKVKVRHPDSVRPGNQEGTLQVSSAK